MAVPHAATNMFMRDFSMTKQELDAIGFTIEGIAEYWLKRQDEATRRIHAAVVDSIQMDPRINYRIVLHTIRCFHPCLLQNRMKLQLRKRIHDFLSAEFEALSPV